MSFDAGAATSRMEIDVGPFRQGVLQAQSISRLFPTFVQDLIADPLLGIISLAKTAGTAIAGAFQMTLGSGLKLAADAEQAEVAFGVMLKSAEKAKEVMAQLTQFGANTPLELPEIVAAARKLLAFKTSADELIPTLTKLGDVSQGIGAPIGEIAEIYGKARVQGRLFMEDINQLAGRGIPVWEGLARQFGTTEDKVRGLVETGKVGFKNIDQLFTDLSGSGGMFEGMMEKQSHTLAGLLSNLEDAKSQLLRNFAEGFAEGFNLKDAIGDAASALGGLLTMARDFGSALGSTLKPILEDLTTWMKNDPEEARQKITAAAQEIIDSVRELVDSLRELVSLGKEAKELFGTFSGGGGIAGALGFRFSDLLSNPLSAFSDLLGNSQPAKSITSHESKVTVSVNQAASAKQIADKAGDATRDAIVKSIQDRERAERAQGVAGSSL